MLELSRLVAELLVVVQMLSGYAVPDASPKVAFVTQGELAAQVCGRPCEVYGWFPPGHTIYLDERLDPLEDLVARSILVHELAHYAQQEAGAFAPGGDCAAWLERERQAYDIQHRWLAAQPGGRDALARLGRRPWKLTCPDAAAASLPEPGLE